MASPTLHRRTGPLFLCLLVLACSRPDEDRPARPQGISLTSATAPASAAPSSANSSVAAPAGSASSGERVAAGRPASWAERLHEHAHLPNLHRVGPSLYRGAQPDDDGFAELKAMGIKTVVNLRSLHSDRRETEEHGLGYVHIKEEAWTAKDKETIAFLKVAVDPAQQPLFVHCQHGADRTGTSIAAYRIVVQGWTKEEAIREMTEGGYGFHAVWSNLIRYVHGLDVEKMRHELGIKAPSAAPQP